MIKASIGLKRIGAGTSALNAGATLSARAGMQAVLRNYIAFCKHMQDITPQVMLNALAPTYDLSQEYVPKDTGALSDSGYLEIIQSRGRPVVEMGYGRGGVPEYAAVVHENLEYHHEAPTRAKYLEAALDETIDTVLEDIAAEYTDLGGFK